MAFFTRASKKDTWIYVNYLAWHSGVCATNILFPSVTALNFLLWDTCRCFPSKTTPINQKISRLLMRLIFPHPREKIFIWILIKTNVQISQRIFGCIWCLFGAYRVSQQVNGLKLRKSLRAKRTTFVENVFCSKKLRFPPFLWTDKLKKAF